jgi:chorismate dehydratase
VLIVHTNGTILRLKSFLCSANLIQLKKIKVGAVTYLNTKPLIYGMQQEDFLREHELILAYPSKLAEMLKKGELDVALVPVALLHELPEYHIVSDYCIASDYEVASVCLFSEKPLSEIRRVYLDYQSKTSVALIKLLFNLHWKKQVEWLPATDESYIDKIQDDTAGLIIGDRALQFRERFGYRYDLATAWREMTGLPFVFAVWVSLKEMKKDWILSFNLAQQSGLSRKNQIVDAVSINNINYDLLTYYKININYHIDSCKQESIAVFLDMGKKLLLDSYSTRLIDSV